MEQIDAHKSFGGQQLRFRHPSDVLNCDMKFSVYLPPQAEQHSVPALYWLSGLTCTDENFMIKSGAQQYAAKYGIAIIAPDTSPRGEDIPNDPEGAYDVGLGAGFYVNATQSPWDQHYHMYDYIVSELPALINPQLPIDGTKISISGHSMGGHGALTIALRNPKKYQSVSAFAPICSPINCPWGNKALSLYLGDDQDTWKQYDTTELIKQSALNNLEHLPILIDQGEQDSFLQEQLKTKLLGDTCYEVNYPMDIRIQLGYDHSYYFIASFIEEHIRFHALYL